MGIRRTMARGIFFVGLAMIGVAAFGAAKNHGMIGGLSEFSGDRNVLRTRTGDDGILKAAADAQQSLPAFLAVAATEPVGWENVNIKVAMEGTSQIENIWVSDFAETGADRFSARLANDPVDLPGLKAGDSVSFGRDQIVDWAFIENGRGYGFYSVRALVPMMDEAQQEAIAAFLAPDPVPAGW